MIFVTHDQEEALTIGDKIAVMKDGVVHQMDTAQNIYHHPANLFVAKFIGSPPINEFECSLEDREGTLRLVSPAFDVEAPAEFATALRNGSQRITLGVRPEFMTIGDAPGQVAGTIKLTELLGSRTLILVDGADQELRVLVQGDSSVKEGERIGLSIQLDRAFYFDDTGASLLTR